MLSLHFLALANLVAVLVDVETRFGGFLGLEAAHVRNWKKAMEFAIERETDGFIFEQ